MDKIKKTLHEIHKNLNPAKSTYHIIWDIQFFTYILKFPKLNAY